MVGVVRQINIKTSILFLFIDLLVLFVFFCIIFTVISNISAILTIAIFNFWFGFCVLICGTIGLKNKQEALRYLTKKEKEKFKPYVKLIAFSCLITGSINFIFAITILVYVFLF